MKKFKATLAAILAVCSLMGLAGCSENCGQSSNLIDSKVDSPNDGGLGSAEVTKTQYAPITLTDNNTLNSIRLFDAITADKANAMFSPVSLNMALGLIEAGAKGDTKAAIDSYLQTENFADITAEYLKFVKENRNKEKISEEWANVPASVLEIANSFWADNALPVKDDYKQQISTKFGAETANLDFADKVGTLNRINGWVNEKTHKMIPSILDDLDPSTAAVLVNTVYFESAWFDKWLIDENSKESFTLADGTVKEIPLMYNGKCYQYFENDHATAFGCGYRNGLTFIGILPKESGEFTLESLDIPSLLESESNEFDVSAVMPRLNFENKFDLKDALTAAGLETIFNGSSADFSGISDEGLFVSKILQNTKLELDENGTKAAAATAVTMDTTGMAMPKERKAVRLDRPFAFMIYDSAMDQILFVGKVTEL